MFKISVNIVRLLMPRGTL